MAEPCVSDTGPLLHLEEIGRLEGLTIFDRIFVSSLIIREVRDYGVHTRKLESNKLLVIQRVLRKEAQAEQTRWPQFRIGVEDASCLVLARKTNCEVVLTDDGELRKAVKAVGRQPVGSVGVLVKNFHTGRLVETEFRQLVERLLYESSLFTSAAFCEYVQRKVKDTIRAQKRRT